jgi:Zn-dependent protease
LVSGVFNEANPESSTRHIETITLHVEAVSPPCCPLNSSVGGLPHLVAMGSYVHPLPRPRRDPVWRRVLSWLGAAGVALSKLKFLASASSMLVSIGAYALIWGFRFGVGFVFLLLVHELGHVIQLRREGIRASAPMFIPFLGAVVAMKELPKDAAAEARVGLAGPVLGSLAALVPLGVYALTGDDFFRALAFVGFFLNLFNLLPVLPLDGGRAMAALSPWMWLAGLALLAGAAVLFPSPIVIVILVLGALETWRRWQDRHTPEGSAFHRVRPTTRLSVAAVYLGLAALLAFGVHATFIPRHVG